jgi:hypothetical protein
MIKITPTRTGPHIGELIGRLISRLLRVLGRAPRFIRRRWAMFIVDAKLKWAVEDRAFIARAGEWRPRQLQTLDEDIGALRVERILLERRD